MNKHAFFVKDNILVRVEKNFMVKNKNGDYIQKYFISISDDDFDLRIHQQSNNFNILANTMKIDCSLFDDDFDSIDTDNPELF